MKSYRWKIQMPSLEEVKNLIEGAGGKVEEMGVLPDSSGFATASFPLPKDHWLYYDVGFEAPPMPFRLGKDHPRHEEFMEAIWAAGKYAVRAATMKGKDDDFDPDAMVQCLVVGLIGYHTPDGLTDDDWANPNPIPPIFGDQPDENL